MSGTALHRRFQAECLTMTIRLTWRVAREHGLSWVWWRSLYEVLTRSGAFRVLFPPVKDVVAKLGQHLGMRERDAAADIGARWRQEAGPWFELPIRDLIGWVGRPEEAVREAQGIVDGRLRFFHGEQRVVGNPPDWFLAWPKGGHWPAKVHWSRLPDLSSRWGDIKGVWEPSRFTHVFVLARAYALTGDPVYSETFWRHVESWMQANSPELGPHWRCGQEISLRSLAWLFALRVFGDDAASSTERVGRLIALLWYNMLHVERIHWYAARCSRNNHAISEAVGLFSVGTLLPFLPQAQRWRERGLRYLADELSWQVYEDGTWVQHSMNYARMVLQLLSWTMSLARTYHIAVPGVIVDRASRLLDFLVGLQDSLSGKLPNYGSNDGSLVFPLSSCGYLDYRPSLNALSVLLQGKALYEPGPWDEEAAWLAGPPAVQRARAARSGSLASLSVGFPTGGYYAARSERTYAFIRCGSYMHRPAQADMLHVDLWVNGFNVLVDPGTFSYNAPRPWLQYFVGTSSHNTVTVDGRDQMTKGPRFMWMGWTRARVLRFDVDTNQTVFEGEHYSYAPVVHRRLAVLRDDVLIVVDRLWGDKRPHAFRLHWLVNDFEMDPDPDGAVIYLPDRDASPLRLFIAAVPSGHSSWVRGQITPPRGWQSLRYGERSPARSFELVVKGAQVQFTTVLGPAEKLRRVLPPSTGNIQETPKIVADLLRGV